jgi:hypothetical protein
MDSLDLAELNVALAVHAPKRMTEGNWTVALYLIPEPTKNRRMPF